MAWIYDTYAIMHRVEQLPVVTGKPLDIGGSFGRHEATARGCLFAASGIGATIVPGLESVRNARVAIKLRQRRGIAAAFHEAPNVRGV